MSEAESYKSKLRNHKNSSSFFTRIIEESTEIRIILHDLKDAEQQQQQNDAADDDEQQNSS